MRNYLLITLSVFSLVLYSCGSEPLERSRVPLLWGMRYDDPMQEPHINRNLFNIRKHGLKNLMLELPLVADSAGYPSIPNLPIGPFRGLLAHYKTTLHLTFAPTATKVLFPHDSLSVEPAAWFARLESLVDSILKEFKPAIAERVVIGSNLTPVEPFDSLWKDMFDSLGAGRGAYFSYGATLDHLNSLPNPKVSDELAIDYTPISGSDMKAMSRDFNAAVEKLADSLHMPVFIFRANLIGEEQTLQLQNRLRFWKPQTRFRGLAINTLYPQLPILDSTTYYGLKDNPEFLEFVQEYRRRD